MLHLDKSQETKNLKNFILKKHNTIKINTKRAQGEIKIKGFRVYDTYTFNWYGCKQISIDIEYSGKILKYSTHWKGADCWFRSKISRNREIKEKVKSTIFDYLKYFAIIEREHNLEIKKVEWKN